MSNITSHSALGNDYIVSTTVNRFLKSVSTILHAAHLNSKATINTKILYEDIVFKVDTENLQTIIMNLVGNLIKYKRKDVDAIVSIEADYEDGKLKFSVVDNGIGIMQKNIEKVMTLFGRGEDNRYVAGFGIGLSIVQMLLQKLNSTLNIESDGESYTKMYFYIDV